MKLLSLAMALAFASGPVLAADPAATPAQPPPAEGDWRTPDPANVLVIDTTKGRIVVEMSPQLAPLATARLRDLARTDFYNGRSFFRVIDNFMDQTGDPKDNGSGGSTLPNIGPEFTFRRGSDTSFSQVMKAVGVEAGFVGSMPVLSQPMDLGQMTADGRVQAYGLFCPGVGGMARAQAEDSGNSQFFLMRGVNNSLDEKYTPWGRVIYGLDVVRAIKLGEPPTPPADRMTSVKVLADMPAASRPTVRVIDTNSAWFKAMVERAKADKGAEVSICEIELPAQVR